MWYPFQKTVTKAEHSSSLPKDRLKAKFSEVQYQLYKDQITVLEAKLKFEEWKSRNNLLLSS